MFVFLHSCTLQWICIIFQFNSCLGVQRLCRRLPWLLLTCITFIAHMWAYSYHCCTFSGPSVCQSVFQSYMSVYLSVCLSVTPMYHAEMAESIQMLFVKVKWSIQCGYSSSQSNLPHAHMPYRITQCCLPPSRGDFPTFIPAEAGTRLSDPRGMQGWVDLVGLLHTEKLYPPEDGHPSKY